jgi:hypothetical protein
MHRYCVPGRTESIRNSYLPGSHDSVRRVDSRAWSLVPSLFVDNGHTATRPLCEDSRGLA